VLPNCEAEVEFEDEAEEAVAQKPKRTYKKKEAVVACSLRVFPLS
jgi:hypothetical protein